ncbi:cbb3-type cytochrome c oxidase subunit 3 [Hansschlegelia zhihuaiae]|uniref:Cbb3-type cytochrome c oxidase subunit 3 n=1 Tax=Hansschlegelia zhihuaiae TaxID=405005 RepID=A0A4Q0MC45_9HYPH|nr:cbb3-type cytochrome c oxidase subunit 3 [Hansschlegelia zhihuaiae]RXF70907.1 cbb3-type cytochrome c oxidase subunit 3 [Hansschlegelia zhihuaiae]
MSFDHDSVVAFAKSFGLFYLLALSACVLVYVYWPSNRPRFDKAAKTILEGEDRPWR